MGGSGNGRGRVTDTNRRDAYMAEQDNVGVVGYFVQVNEEEPVLMSPDQGASTTDQPVAMAHLSNTDLRPR